jgi:hypothetical protein
VASDHLLDQHDLAGAIRDEAHESLTRKVLGVLFRGRPLRRITFRSRLILLLNISPWLSSLSFWACVMITPLPGGDIHGEVQGSIPCAPTIQALKNDARVDFMLRIKLPSILFVGEGRRKRSTALQLVEQVN